MAGDNTTAELLAEHAALLSSHASTLAAGSARSLVESLMASTDTDLLDFHQHAAAVLKLAEAAVVAVSGEVARRSESGLPDSLARRSGEKSAAALLAARSGLHETDTSLHCSLGLALSPREGLTGEVLPTFFPVLADAVSAGSLTARQSRTVLTALLKIEPQATAHELSGAERFLVEGAADWSAKTLQDVCRMLPDRFDPDGVAPRESAIRARRGIRKRVLDDGTVQYVINTDAEGGAYLDAALDARTAPRRQVRFQSVIEGDDEVPLIDPARADERSWSQKRHDALIELVRDSLRHDDGEIGGVDTTAVIHVPLETLTTGTGTAWFEGIEVPVSAQTAQRVVSCADVVGYIFDGQMQPLQLGATSRFFTTAQRRAMAARDGGCVWPGCESPPRWCDAAHIEPWVKSRRTDIDNGVLLCHFHHRRYDEDGWLLHLEDGVPWFTPPSHVDARRTPRRGGKTPSYRG